MIKVSLLKFDGQWMCQTVTEKIYCEPQHNTIFEAKFAESRVESFRQLYRVSACAPHAFVKWITFICNKSHIYSYYMDSFILPSLLMLPNEMKQNICYPSELSIEHFILYTTFIMPSATVWGGRLYKRFCNMFSDSSTGSWAELQLPCCPSRARGTLRKM